MDAQAESAARPKPCPRCQVALQSIALGSVKLRQCPKCEGFWVDVETFNEICRDRERQAAVLGGASPPPARLDLTLDPVRYLHCPECHTLMNRVNFSGHSGVVIDACRGHGTWFDRNELQQIVEFIRAGGLDLARKRDLEQLARVQANRPPTHVIESPAPGDNWSLGQDKEWDFLHVLDVIGSALVRLFSN